MSKFTILIGDDIRKYLLFKTLIEESFNVNILTAQSAQKAIEILLEQSWFNIDRYSNADIDGFEFVQYIKRLMLQIFQLYLLQVFMIEGRI